MLNISLRVMLMVQFVFRSPIWNSLFPYNNCTARPQNYLKYLNVRNCNVLEVSFKIFLRNEKWYNVGLTSKWDKMGLPATSDTNVIIVQSIVSEVISDGQDRGRGGVM